MAFELRADESVARGVARRSQGDRQGAGVPGGRKDGEGGTDGAVHDACKRLKKVRAVLRLVPGGLAALPA